MKRARIIFIATIAVTTAVIAADAPVVISQKGLKFSQDQVTLKKGGSIVFSNDDRTSHNITVTGDGVNVNGGLQAPGGEFRMPFAKPGEYVVTCGIHPKMKMSVKVE